MHVTFSLKSHEFFFFFLQASTLYTLKLHICKPGWMTKREIVRNPTARISPFWGCCYTSIISTLAFDVTWAVLGFLVRPCRPQDRLTRHKQTSPPPPPRDRGQEQALVWKITTNLPPRISVDITRYSHWQKRINYTQLVACCEVITIEAFSLLACSLNVNVTRFRSAFILYSHRSETVSIKPHLKKKSVLYTNKSIYIYIYTLSSQPDV